MRSDPPGPPFPPQAPHPLCGLSGSRVAVINNWVDTTFEAFGGGQGGRRRSESPLSHGDIIEKEGKKSRLRTQKEH